MGWKFSLAQRIRMGLAMLVVFLLILATNLVDRRYFNVVQKSITTVYEDRLLAKDYIYKISRQLQKKRDFLAIEDKAQVKKKIIHANDSIQILTTKFAATRLTDHEAILFESLKKNLDELYDHERRWSLDASFREEGLTAETIDNTFQAIYDDLDALAKIQIEEGKNEIIISTETINTSNLISRLEIVMLVIIGVLIQLLIFLKPLSR
ncbi:MAG: MCP four helix bundle domain-containing protein [Marinoscillum sp.]|uniref:MCP four helix bundle domain-containing protein n=1 Tax=Marinoscillum sp. TaxID=2024838 RepID=UPI0032FB00CC